MKTAGQEARVVRSVLERLIDRSPKSSVDVLPSRAESLRQLRRDVRDHLEDLLNSRNTFSDLAPGFAEIGHSVLTYGLPDFSTLNALVARDLNRVRQVIETTIRTFEPRLTGVVAMIAGPTQTDRSIRLHIEARLVTDPSSPINFDIVMPLSTRKYEVKGGE